MTTTNLKHSFSVCEDREGMLHIAANPDRKVTKRTEQVESNVRSAHETELVYSRELEVFCRRETPKGAVLKPYWPEPSLRRAVTGSKAPTRDYFHPVSFGKVTVGEWMLLDTIVRPSDDSWEVRIANAMLHDFVDVSSSEKEFFKVWNGFIRSQNFISVKDYPSKCKEFIKQHAKRMSGFEEHWITHLTTLWEEHQISRDDIQAIMKFYSETIKAL